MPSSRSVKTLSAAGFRSRTMAGQIAEKRRAKTSSRYSSRRQNSVVARPRAGLPLPERLTTRLTFSLAGVTATGSTGSLGYQQVVLNGPYNPIPTTHQPMGWDQLMGTFYQFCRVISAKVTAVAQPGTAGGNNPFIGIQITENSSYAPSSMTQIIERGNCVYKMVPNQVGCSNAVIVSKKWKASDWYAPGYDKDSNNWCTASANPTGELCYANVFVLQSNGQTYADIYYNIIVEYEVEMFGQLQLNQS